MKYMVLTTLSLKICLQGCYAVSMCKWYSTFQRNAVISFIIGTKQFKKWRHYDPWKQWELLTQHSV